ncbi:uncharacterized protein UTRI_00346 [Ustilago trichophora]|uniref:Uncharacterized protein n=1 Tax=Ustilago trichophora TaxID=86804 RepID=A0A5C3DV13_9BASI|nr:uncharacterized protein UTRI_00346 [Ustilago trichophora]
MYELSCNQPMLSIDHDQLSSRSQITRRRNPKHGTSGCRENLKASFCDLRFRDELVERRSQHLNLWVTAGSDRSDTLTVNPLEVRESDRVSLIDRARAYLDRGELLVFSTLMSCIRISAVDDPLEKQEE